MVKDYTEQALLIVDHGSTYDKANQSLKDVAKLVSQKRPDLIIEYAHMEIALPSIADGYQRCIKRGATTITVHPYMLSEGKHAITDIPNLVHQIAQKYPGVTTHVTQPLGPHIKIAEVILEKAGF